jgi:hypothetical protein
LFRSEFVRKATRPPPARTRRKRSSSRNLARTLPLLCSRRAARVTEA